MTHQPARFGRRAAPPPGTPDDDGAIRMTAEEFRAQLAAERQSAAAASAEPRGNDEIDYRIEGAELQMLEIELDPGESAVAEAGSLVWKDACVEMTTVFGKGDGQESGIKEKLLSAGKRVVTGESIFTTVFTHRGVGKARVAFAAPVPGNILPIRLADHGGMLICQKDSFLAGAKGVSIGVHFQQKIMTGLFGGEGFIMQRLEGEGWVFVQMGGTVIARELAQGEHIHVDTGCVAAFEKTVDMTLIGQGGVKNSLFGGEGLFLVRLSGPGKVWIQSLPFARLAGRMMAASGWSGPLARGANRGEGSALGGIGDILQANF